MYGLIILFVSVTLHKMRALGYDTEPRCSKYDFEEKVLEKMVRVEHSTNLIMDEFRAIKTQVASTLDTMRKEADEMKTVLEEERKRITDTMTAEIANNREVLKIEGKSHLKFYRARLTVYSILLCKLTGETRDLTRLFPSCNIDLL